MSKDIKKRTIAEAKYIIKNRATVRETGFVFKVSKINWLKVYIRF